MHPRFDRGSRHRRTARLARLVVSASVLSLLAAAPGPRSTNHLYRAQELDMYVGYERITPMPDTPAGRPAPLGNFSFLPSEGTFRLTIDDAGTLRGRTVPVRLITRTRDVWVCVPSGRTRTFRGFPHGQSVYVAIYGAVSRAYMGPMIERCDGFATAGKATVTLR